MLLGRQVGRDRVLVTLPEGDVRRPGQLRRRAGDAPLHAGVLLRPATDTPAEEEPKACFRHGIPSF